MHNDQVRSDLERVRFSALLQRQKRIQPLDHYLKGGQPPPDEMPEDEARQLAASLLTDEERAEHGL